jgi:C-terminal processing protease CtpA/Prc
MRTLVLTLLFIAGLPLASGSLRPERESEFWKDSGLDLKLVTRLISTAECMASEQYYDSCRRALYAGALLTGHASQFQGLRSSKFPRKLEFDFLLTRVLQGATAAVPREMIMGRMISAQLQVFDRYAQMIPADYLSELLNGRSKTYMGFGFETEVSGAGLHLFNVFPGTPAAAADLRAGDRIVSVDGIMASGLHEAKVVSDFLSGAKRAVNPHCSKLNAPAGFSSRN